jgi:hypothetical protein
VKRQRPCASGTPFGRSPPGRFRAAHTRTPGRGCPVSSTTTTVTTAACSTTASKGSPAASGPRCTAARPSPSTRSRIADSQVPFSTNRPVASVRTAVRGSGAPDQAPEVMPNSPLPAIQSRASTRRPATG